jgi:DNA-binding Lrp family transcriptional regulator
MSLTPTEQLIVERLKKRGVEKFSRLAEAFRVSAKTVQRALAKVEHLTSINRNAAYVALQETARFDEWGLWKFRTTCFSSHGNLLQTIQALVEHASGGCTLTELEQLLETRVHNHVSRLLREGRLARCSLGRHAVYVASNPRRQQEQWTARQQKVAPVRATDRPRLQVPPGLDFITVIRVLIRLLEAPEASLASVSRWLQARQVDVRVDQIRQILDFYGLKKTNR